VQVTGLCNTLDIDENLIQNSVLVYPNPSKGIINLDLTDVNETELTIYNVAGQKVFTKKINEKKSKLDLNKFNKGIYFLNFKNNDGASIKKIILDK
jgi:penicillin-binding protein-related factor A (putative recombinase)